MKKKLYISPLLSLSLLFFSYHSIAIAASSVMAPAKQTSAPKKNSAPTSKKQPPASLEDFQSQWENLAPAEQEAAAAALIENLKPEERAVFDKIMDKFNAYTSEELEAIFSDEKLTEELFGTILNEQDFAPAPQPQQQAPSPSEVKEEEEEIPAAPRITSVEEKLMATLTELKAKLTDFTVKTAALPRLPVKVPHWGSKKCITPWNPAWSWASFLADLEQFQEHLSKALKRDARNNPVYAKTLLADEGLVKQLECLLTALTPCVKAIQVSPLTFETVTAPLSRCAKAALQKTVGLLAEYMYICNIPKMLYTTLEKNNGDAKKNEGKSTGFSYKNQAPGRMTVAGKGIENEGYQPLTPAELSAYRKPSYVGSSAASGSVPSSLPDVYKVKPSASSPSTDTTSSSGQEKSDKEKKETTQEKESSSKKGGSKKSDELSTEVLISLNNIINSIHDSVDPLRIDTNSLDPVVVEFSIKSAARKLAGKTNSALENIKALQLKLRSATRHQKEKVKKDITEAFASNSEFFDPYVKQAKKERELGKKPTSAVIELADAVEEMRDFLQSWK